MTDSKDTDKKLTMNELTTLIFEDVDRFKQLKEEEQHLRERIELNRSSLKLMGVTLTLEDLDDSPTPVTVVAAEVPPLYADDVVQPARGDDQQMPTDNRSVDQVRRESLVVDKNVDLNQMGEMYANDWQRAIQAGFGVSDAIAGTDPKDVRTRGFS